MYIKFSALFLAIIGSLFTTGCKGGGKHSALSGIEADDSIPAGVKRLVSLVASDDSVGFSKIVSYPLQRPYPLKDIEDEKEMQAYYHYLVDDSLRNAITHAGPSNWSEYGWRGWSLDDGRYVWIDDNVYAVNYISRHERHMLDSLTRSEIASLAPELRSGWHPVMCLKNDSDGTVYRIDSVDSNHDGTPDGTGYRLAVYNPATDLHGVPDHLINGELTTEGTAGVATFAFVDDHGSRFEIEPDSPDSGPVLFLPNDSTVSLTRSYWHKLVEQR